MSMAIKYAMMKKHKMAHGGEARGPSHPCAMHGIHDCPKCYRAEGGEVEGDTVNADYVPAASKKTADSFRKALNTPGYAKGGFIEDEMESGYEGMPKEHEMHNKMAEEEDDDMISRIMHNRYSKGGKVANDTGDGMDADLDENQFDDLVKDDDLEFHDTGKNSGDEIGDEQEDEDRRDIVARIMKSRKKKDRMPHPA